MALPDHTYRRVVAWAKIVLPLAALALLSTLFLFSRSTPDAPALPFSEDGIADRLAGERLTQPFFAGTTETGDALTIAAATASPDSESDASTRAEDVTGSIRLASGTMIELRAASARFDETRAEARLEGGVVVDSSIGYRMETSALTSSLEHLRASSDGAVAGHGPPGRFTAGRMALDADDATGDAHLRFTGGVKLVYDPKSK